MDRLYFAESVSRDSLLQLHIQKANDAINENNQPTANLLYEKGISQKRLDGFSFIPEWRVQYQFNTLFRRHIESLKHYGPMGNFSLHVLPEFIVDMIPEKYRGLVLETLLPKEIQPATCLVSLDLFTTGKKDPIGTIYSFNTSYVLLHKDSYYIDTVHKLINANASIKSIQRESGQIARVVESLNLGTALRGGDVSPR